MENNQCENIPPMLPINDNCGGELNNKDTHTFINGKYYINDCYYGDVIYSDNKLIQVQCNNGNKFMNGQILTIHIRQ